MDTLSILTNLRIWAKKRLLNYSGSNLNLITLGTEQLCNTSNQTIRMWWNWLEIKVELLFKNFKITAPTVLDSAQIQQVQLIKLICVKISLNSIDYL